jgi:hypothetical protein
MTSQQQIRASGLAILAMLIITIAAAAVQTADAATSSNLSISSTGTVLTASRNNTLAIEISNIGKYLKELDIALTIPPPLALFGDNHWIRQSFSPGETINANLTLFAPSSAAGTTLQGSIVATYKATGEITPSTETHAISFLVRGWIDLKVYEIAVNPDPVFPGQEIVVSGNILNRGVISAMYANVTVDAEQIFDPESIRPTYVGEIEPNAPAPFSVTALVESTTPEGPQQAVVSVYFRDDVQLDHVVDIPIRFVVASKPPITETRRTDLASELLSNQILMFGILAVIALALVVSYLRRRRGHAESD